MQDINLSETMDYLKAKYDNMEPLENIVPDDMKNGKDSPVINLEYRSKRIVEWIKSHPIINKAGLCQAVGMDKSNFKRIYDNEKPLFKEGIVFHIEGTFI